MDPERWAGIGIIAAAGLVAGLVYWRIAGRNADFRRPLSKRWCISPKTAQGFGTMHKT